MNVTTWLQRHAGRLRDEPAVAGGLRERFGLSSGDRVAFVMRNRPEYLEALFATWHAGLVVVPVNARLHRSAVSHREPIAPPLVGLLQSWCVARLHDSRG